MTAARGILTVLVAVVVAWLIVVIVAMEAPLGSGTRTFEPVSDSIAFDFVLSKLPIEVYSTSRLTVYGADTLVLADEETVLLVVGESLFVGVDSVWAPNVRRDYAVEFAVDSMIPSVFSDRVDDIKIYRPSDDESWDWTHRTLITPGWALSTANMRCDLELYCTPGSLGYVVLIDPKTGERRVTKLVPVALP